MFEHIIRGIEITFTIETAEPEVGYTGGVDVLAATPERGADGSLTEEAQDFLAEYDWLTYAADEETVTGLQEGTHAFLQEHAQENWGEELLDVGMER